MHSMPTRVALAGSVLVLGSVGTVSAVQLQSAPSPLGMIPGAALALSPAPTAPQSSSPTLSAPADIAPAPERTPAAAPHSLPRSAKDLAELAGPLPRRTVSVAVREAEDAVESAVDSPVDSDSDSDGSHDDGADASDTDGYGPVRQVAVRNSRREFSDAVAGQVQREFAQRVTEQYAEPAGQHRANTRTWRAAPDRSAGARRISNPFQAGQARQVGGFGAWGVSGGNYVGRHRAG